MASQASEELVPTFDRFGWYWQPAKMLESMTPQDAIDATVQATDIQSQAKNLQKQAQLEKKKAAATRAAEQKILDSLYKD